MDVPDESLVRLDDGLRIYAASEAIKGSDTVQCSFLTAS